MAVPLIIQVQLDDAALQTGVDKLQSLGQVDAQSAVIFKQTNAALASRLSTISDLTKNTDKLTASVTPQQAIFNKLVASVQNLSGASRDAVQQLLKFSAINNVNLANAFGDAAVNVDDYVKALEEAEKGHETFNASSIQTTTRLNEIKNELAALGPITNENRAQFAALTAEGGKLQEGLNQARGALRTFGSESPVLSAATNVARGLTGAFQAGAAAATLFGDANKDLQEVLVKVFQITSITQGIQEVLNAVNTKGSITVLELAAANKTAEINEFLNNIQKKGGITITEDLTAAQTASLAVTKQTAEGTAELATAQTVNAAVSKEAAVSTEALATAQGVSAVVTKEAALGTEALNTAEAENIVVTEGATVATEELTTVTIGQAIAARAAQVAQLLFNAAVATGPLGLFVIGVGAAVTALVVFAGRAKEAKQRLEELNDSLFRTTLLEQSIAAQKANTEQFVAQLEARNAKESEITKAQNDNIREAIAARNQKILDDDKKFSALQAAADATNRSGLRKELQDQANQIDTDRKKLLADNEADFKTLNLSDIQLAKQTSQEKLQLIRDEAAARLQLTVDTSRANFAAQRLENNAQLALDLKAAGDNEGKIVLARAAAAKNLRDINAAEVAQEAQDRLTAEITTLTKIQIESRRINTIIAADETAQQNKILQDQANDKIKALQKQAQDDVSFAKQAAIQIALIQAQTQAQIEENNRQQRIRDITTADQDQIARNQVVLDGIKATNKERLNLQIENEHLSRDVALQNQNLTEAGRKEIIAASEENIRQLRNDFIQKQADDEIELLKETGALQLNELQRQLDAQAEIRAAGVRGNIVAAQLNVPKLNLDQQIEAINQITQAQLDQNTLLIKANDAKSQSEEDFTKTDAQLTTQRVAIRKNGELEIQKATKATADFTRSTNEQIFQASLQAAQQIVGFIDQVFQAQEQQQQNALDARRKQTQDELDAGAITAKAAAERNKELDAQEKQLQREQAKRQKETALFNAIIQTASAVATALTAGPVAGIIAAAAAAAIGAAQIAVILATPIPQFYKGKNTGKPLDRMQRDGYEGWAEIGDRGAELWKSGSQTKLVDKPTVVWVKKNDIIYNAAQTATIMKAPQFSPAVMNSKIPTVVINTPAIVFDYKKLADAVSKKSSVSLNIDGYKDFIQTEQSFTAYLNKRRKWL